MHMVHCNLSLHFLQQALVNTVVGAKQQIGAVEHRILIEVL